MTLIQRITATWMAFPSAPETRRLRFLRLQFLFATFATSAVLLRLHSLWEPHRGITILAGPLGLFTVISGYRYFRAKQAADDAHRDALMEASARKGEGA